MSNEPLPKSEWGPGPWQDEPDEATWVDPTTGYTCEILRNDEVTGALCGYVHVPIDHPLAGENYHDYPSVVHEAAHGGITYAKPIHYTTGSFIKIGFDCSKAWDYSPLMELSWQRLALGSPLHHSDDVYREWPYVKACVEKLALVLKQIEEAGRGIA